MTSHINKREREIWYPILVNNYGETCSMCGRTPKAKKPEDFVTRLLIHETEYKRPLEFKYLKLMCDKCNQLVHPPKEEKFKREMTPELSINRIKEPRAREYIVNRILVDGSCGMRKLIYATSEKVGCSTKAVGTYLDKLTSDEGPLEEVFGDVYLRGYEPKIEFDIMSNTWVVTEKAKDIPPEIIKEIQRNLLIKVERS